MKKTVRVCDGCGDKIIAGEWANCAVCDKDICRACAGEMELWLCPTHYQQVKEFIEGLKEPPTIHAYDEQGDLVDAGTRCSVAHRDGKYLAITPSGCSECSVPEWAANALYEHIRSERNGEG